MIDSLIRNSVILSDRYTNGRWVRKNRSKLVSLAFKNLNQDSSIILDLGCGTGAYSDELLLMFPKASTLIGIDILKDNIKQAKKDSSAQKTEFIIADGHFLPFGDKCLGAVLSKDVIHHANNPMQVINEIVRICNGPSVIIEANKSNPIMVLNEKYGHHHLTTKQLEFLAKKSGADFKMFYSYDYPFTMRLPSLNPVVNLWNLGISLLLITCNNIPLTVNFFARILGLLTHSYNGVSFNPMNSTRIR